MKMALMSCEDVSRCFRICPVESQRSVKTGNVTKPSRQDLAGDVSGDDSRYTCEDDHEEPGKEAIPSV